MCVCVCVCVCVCITAVRFLVLFPLGKDFAAEATVAVRVGGVHFDIGLCRICVCVYLFMYV